MDPMTYGEMVADRIREARELAARERRAMSRSVHATAATMPWRVMLGRGLVLLGDRVAGCAELARAEIGPSVRLIG